MEHPAALATADAPCSQPAPSSIPLLAGFTLHFRAASPPWSSLASLPAAPPGPGSLPCNSRLPSLLLATGQRVTWLRGYSAPPGCGPWDTGAGAGEGRVGRRGGRRDNSGSRAGAVGADGAGERDEPSPNVLGSLAPRQRHGVQRPPAPPPCTLHPLGAGRTPAPHHGPVVLPPGLGGHHTGSEHQPHGPHSVHPG